MSVFLLEQCCSTDGGLWFNTSLSIITKAVWFREGLTTCLADMMVQMKIPTETKAIDRYLLAEYLQKDNKKVTCLYKQAEHSKMCTLQV